MRSLIALQHLALRPLGNVDDPKHLPPGQRLPRLDQGRGAGDDPQRFVGVQSPE